MDIAPGVVTDGTPETQRAKITALGLSDFFAVTLIAGEVGLEKSDERLYQQAAGALECFTVRDVDGQRALRRIA